MKSLAIIGGGMSGCIAGIVAANNNLKIDIYERQDEVLKKLLLTGNGRCNISNENIKSSDYITDSSIQLEKLLSNFSCADEQALFSNLGIYTRTKNGGLYPCTNKASTIRNTIVNLLKVNNINTYLNAYINCIEAENDKYFLNNREYDYILLSCGGMAGVYKESEKNGYCILKNLGIKYSYCYPGLVQVKCKTDMYKSLKGLRFEATVTLLADDRPVASEKGEVQVTENGLSGIVIFQLSRYIGKLLREGKKLSFKVDLLYDFSNTQLINNFKVAKSSLGNVSLDKYLSAYVDERILITISSISNYLDKNIREISDNEIIAIINGLKGWMHQIKELNPFKNAQVSVGGLYLDALNEDFMLKSHRNLFVTGEMLDATGKCGGYNLHFATLSGYIAGQYIKKDSIHA